MQVEESRPGQRPEVANRVVLGLCGGHRVENTFDPAKISDGRSKRAYSDFQEKQQLFSSCLA